MIADLPETSGSILADMKADLLTDKKGDGIWILHDKPMPRDLKKIVYHESHKRLHFVMKNDVRLDFGAPVNPNVQPYMNKPGKIMLILIKGESIGGLQFLPYEIAP